MVPYVDTAILTSMADFYGWPLHMPIGQQLVTRSNVDNARPKRLYFVSAGESSTGLVRGQSCLLCFELCLPVIPML